MKTITEYQPMIFSALFSRSEHRKTRSHQILRRTALLLAIGYVILGLKITTDTGLAAWDWQFWFIFAPLFLLGERLLKLLSHLRLA